MPNTLSNRLIQYLETLTITQGRRSGGLFEVIPWQRRFIRGSFAPGIVEGALSVGRGNGKSALCAGIATAALDGPLVVPRAETVVAASSFDQAKIIFGHVLAFLRAKYGEGLEDRSIWRVQDSANKAQIVHRPTGAMLKCVGSDPRRMHGLAPALILCDEGAQWEPATCEASMSALRTALGKLPDGRMIALGTRPADGEHWFAKMLDGGADYSQVHAAAKDDPKFQRRTWVKANPSLRAMPDLERAIRREGGKAKLDPALMAAFDALRLNLGTSDIVRSLLLDSETWQRIEGEADMGGRCFWGVDLGTSSAQSAVSAFWPDTGRLESLAAFPNEPTLAERGIRDAVGRLYTECARKGELIQLGGHAVDVGELIREARDRFGAPAGLASDRWREAELRDALKAAGLPLTRLELRGMGYKDGAADVRSFRRACLEGRVTPLPSLLLASAIGEARTLSDPAGNSKLAKGSEGGRRLRARDDAAAAAILAVGLADRQPKRRTSIYRGLAG